MVAIKRLAGATAVRMSWRNGSGQARTLAGTLARARLVLGLGLVCLWPMVAGAQPPPAAEKIDTRRYGIALNTRLYPQDNPKAALQSLLTALEKKQYAYAVAHLLDPDVVDKRINERMVLYLAQAEKDLQQQRQREQQQLIPPSQRLSSDPKRWKALVEQTAREYAFRELVQQVQQRLEEEPHTVRTLARILVAGT
ncbi:MAG: hypothetical protein NZ703_05275, partial [Gemmataceae bacterium]|nr:hypothetical protein [Gemmataceae bacterium]